MHDFFGNGYIFTGSLAFGVTTCGIKVAAFEPYQQTFRLLQESMALNRFTNEQIQLYNMALGNITGTACLAASSSDRSMARIYTGKRIGPCGTPH